MRVISGKYKGIKLASPKGEVRPTTDLVKGSLFSVLDSRGLISGAVCLDLFSGSGALGIEAISRGAKQCVFCDIDTKNVRLNLDKLKLTERVVCADFRRALRLLREQKFDIIFCDPPYKTDFGEEAYKLICRYGMAEGGVVVLEHASEKDLKNIPESSIIDHRVFGASAFGILRGKSESDFCGNV